MEEAEFDKFADEYKTLHSLNIALSGETPDYFAEYKIRDIAAEYKARSPHREKPSIVDLGAGIGNSVPYLRKYFACCEITCLDVSTRSLAVGQSRFGDQARFVHFDGQHLPLPDASIDIVFAACVFHHIAPQRHRSLLDEFRRVLRQSGLAFVFEHNPWNPITRRAVDTCPFDENAILIAGPAMRAALAAAGFGQVKLRYRIFFPHLLKRLRPCEAWLRWLPVGAQYYVVAQK